VILAARGLQGLWRLYLKVRGELGRGQCHLRQRVGAQPCGYCSITLVKINVVDTLH
jgi:hypothetical protein